MLRRIPFLLFLLIALGCGKPGGGSDPGVEVLPSTPPPSPKAFRASPRNAYRPTFVFADGKKASAGTAFIVKAPSGKKLAMTAAHVLDPKEWAAVKSVLLSTMQDNPVAKLVGKPFYVGKGFDELPMLDRSAGIFDTSEDFAIWNLPEKAALEVLELAEGEPKVNEWVWIIGQEPGNPLLAYRCKVTVVKGGSFLLEATDRHAPRGFSGGPIVNGEGKVVGTMLAGDPAGTSRQGATVGNIRKRIARQ